MDIISFLTNPNNILLIIIVALIMYAVAAVGYFIYNLCKQSKEFERLKPSIKPCPSCGNTHISIDNAVPSDIGTIHRKSKEEPIALYCENCGFDVERPSRTSIADLIEAWNNTKTEHKAVAVSCPVCGEHLRTGERKCRKCGVVLMYANRGDEKPKTKY